MAIPATSCISGNEKRGRYFETTINIHYNDIYCLALHKELGVDYLYPESEVYPSGQQPSAGANVNVNVLLLKVDDYDKINTVRPAWDAVKKTWVYEGIAPLVQMNDITTPR